MGLWHDAVEVFLRARVRQASTCPPVRECASCPYHNICPMREALDGAQPGQVVRLHYTPRS